MEIGKVLAGIGLLATLLFAGFMMLKFWDEIRENVCSWLRKHDLQESALMEVLIRFDSISVGIRTTLFVKTRKTGEQKIMERELTDAEIEALKKKEPEVYDHLKRQGFAQKDLLYLFQ
ncbi:hypothetical protein [Desulfatirhabdium butyrativorans]|uniref:hypothetical protein n=1 Tax=Desulfatirhabdium butyrativorans TaxID=340467 RepID=UPI0004181439|nr:hypothetical protein [Desulfatirhabdium butyrativorans]